MPSLDTPLTPYDLEDLCKRAFPGANLEVTRPHGVARIAFQIWQFELAFSLTTLPMNYVSKTGQFSFVFRFRYAKDTKPIDIWQEKGLYGIDDARRQLVKAQRYLEEVSTSIAAAFSPKLEDYPVDLLGNGGHTTIT